MEVIPAIDLRGGACVRLYQGDFSKETVFSEDPVQVALRWQEAGALRLHVVDLDGSKEGAPANLEVIKALAAAVSVPRVVGGGVRTVETARELFEGGIDRVVLGTAPVENPGLVKALCQEWGGERVVVALDGWEGKVAIKGWRESTDVKATDLALDMMKLGVLRFLYTDISRDGTMTSPDYAGVEAMVCRTGVAVLASGGVSSVDDIRRLLKTGAEGVVVGSALYRGGLDLAQALEAAREPGA